MSCLKLNSYMKAKTNTKMILLSAPPSSLYFVICLPQQHISGDFMYSLASQSTSFPKHDLYTYNKN